MFFEGPRRYDLRVNTAYLQTFQGSLRQKALAWRRLSVSSAKLPGTYEPHWQGQTATKITAELRLFSAVTRRAEDSFFDAADAVQKFANKAEDLQQLAYRLNTSWLEKEDHYRRARNAVTPDPFMSSGTGLNTPLAPQYNPSNPGYDANIQAAQDQADRDWAGVQAGLDSQFQKIQEELETAAKTLGRELSHCQLVHLSTAIQAPGYALTPLGASTARGEALNQMGMTKSLAQQGHAQGGDLFPDIPAAQAEANRIADLRKTGQPLSAQDAQLLQAAAKHPQFAQAYITRLGPQALLAGPARANAQTAALRAVPTPTSTTEADAYLRGQEVIINAEAALLTTATNNPEFPATFTQEILDRATTDRNSAIGLNVFLHRGGRFGDEFDRTVSEQLYAADRDPTSLGYRMRVNPQTATDHEYDIQLYGTTEWNDPMTGVMAMKSRNAASAQEFFLTPENTEQSNRPNRLDYLMKDRTWDTNNGSDGGNALGEAIETATTTYRDNDGEGSPGWKSATITGQVFGNLSHETGTGDKRIVTYTIPDRMKDSIAKVHAEYILDFLKPRAVKQAPAFTVTKNDWPGFPPGQPHGVYVADEDRRAMLRELASDPEAVTALVEAELAVLNRDLAYAGKVLHGKGQNLSPEEAHAYYANVVQRHADYVGDLDQAIGEQKIRQGAEYDQKTKAATDIWATVAKTPLKMIPGIGPVIESSYEIGLIGSQNKIKDTFGIDREEQARLAATEDDSLMKGLRDIVIRRAFADKIYTTKSFDNVDERKVENLDSLIFLDDKGEVLPLDDLTLEQRESYQKFIDDRQGKEHEWIANKLGQR